MNIDRIITLDPLDDVFQNWREPVDGRLRGVQISRGRRAKDCRHYSQQFERHFSNLAGKSRSNLSCQIRIHPTTAPDIV